jgi:hypothetical protein
VYTAGSLTGVSSKLHFPVHRTPLPLRSFIAGTAGPVSINQPRTAARIIRTPKESTDFVNVVGFYGWITVDAAGALLSSIAQLACVG